MIVIVTNTFVTNWKGPQTHMQPFLVRFIPNHGMVHHGEIDSSHSQLSPIRSVRSNSNSEYVSSAYVVFSVSTKHVLKQCILNLLLNLT